MSSKERKATTTSACLDVVYAPEYSVLNTTYKIKMTKKPRNSRKPLHRALFKRLLDKKNRKYVALAAVLLVAAVGATMVLLTSAEAPDSAEAEQQEFELLALINKDRQAAGLQVLRMQVQSRDYARFHAKDMRNQNNIWHDMPAYGAVLPAGYRSYAENVAFNSSVSSVHTALMNSPGHRTNIMNGSYNLYRYWNSPPCRWPPVCLGEFYGTSRQRRSC